MIKQWAPAQPLAGKTNQEAWALLLDDGVWEAACPRRLLAASGALRRITRFYIRRILLQLLPERGWSQRALRAEEQAFRGEN